MVNFLKIDRPPLYLDDDWTEVEGLLKKIKKKDNRLILTFEKIAIIELPYLKDIEALLKKGIGKKVGILKTDYTETPYRIKIEERLIQQKVNEK